MDSLNFIIVETNPVIIDALKSVLEVEFSANVISIISSDEELFCQKRTIEVHVIFINLEIAEKNGLTTIKKFLWDYPFVKIIGINTNNTKQTSMLKLIEAGMKGCIDGNNIYNETKEAVNNVIQGFLFFTNKIKNKVRPDQDEMIS